MSAILVLAQALSPVDCVFTGLCAVAGPPPGPPSGVMFVALGLVTLGVAGLRKAGRAPRSAERSPPVYPSTRPPV